MHCGRIFASGGFAGEEQAAADAHRHRIVVLPPQAAHCEAGVGSVRHGILTPPGTHCLRETSRSQDLVR